MSAPVLYDVAGPATRRRHRLYAVLTVLVLAALAAAVVAVLAGKGQLSQQKWEFLQDEGTWRAVRQGLQRTLSVAVMAILLALAFGTVFAVGRLSRRWWLRWPAVVVIEFFRAIPLLLLILFVYLGYSSTTGRFWALVLALMLYNGSVLAEIFRAGIAAVPKGQVEAAYALGLRKGQVLRLVQMPQAVRTMLPAIISQSVVALKDSALGYVIGYLELARVGQSLYVFYNNPLQAGLLIATIYIVINYLLSKLAVLLGRQRQARPFLVPEVARIESGMGQPGAR